MPRVEHNEACEQDAETPTRFSQTGGVSIAPFRQDHLRNCSRQLKQLYDSHSVELAFLRDLRVSVVIVFHTNTHDRQVTPKDENESAIPAGKQETNDHVPHFPQPRRYCVSRAPGGFMRFLKHNTFGA